MYNLIVSAASDAWSGSDFSIENSRYLEHTEAEIRDRFHPLTESVIEELTRIPAVFAHETFVGKSARVGFIKKIRSRQGEIRISFDFDTAFPPIPPETFTEHSWDLDIDKFEMNRTHWAVKDVDLNEALAACGLLDSNYSSSDVMNVSRRSIIAATNLLAETGHTPFDQMLLEFGVSGLGAGRDLGGLQARAHALAAFAVEHPSTSTLDGLPLSVAILSKAAEYVESLVDRGRVPDRNTTWGKFNQALRSDGLEVRQGQVVKREPEEPQEPSTIVSSAQSTRPPTGRAAVGPLSPDSQAFAPEDTPASPLIIQPTVFRMPTDGIQENLVSIMMPFDMSFNSVHQAIKDSCQSVSLVSKRADGLWEDSTIMQDVFSLIYRSRIVVVDFTNRNPNVFYETGIAHTLGKPVIPITQNESDVPFDLRSHRHLRYLNNNEGLQNLTEKLASRLRTLIGQNS